MLNDLSGSFLEFLQRRMRGKVTSIFTMLLRTLSAQITKKKIERCCGKE